MNECFTKIPNFYFDLLPLLTESANKCYLCICRKTIGWRKEWAKITRKEFCSFTGLLPQAIRKGILVLLDHKLILVKLQGKVRLYKINMESHLGVKITPKDRGENHPQMGVKITPKCEKIGVINTPIKGCLSPLSFSEDSIDARVSGEPKETLKEKKYKETHKERENPVCVGNLTSQDEEEEKHEEEEEEKEPGSVYPPQQPEPTQQVPAISQAPPQIPLDRILAIYPTHERMILSKAQAAWDTLTNPEKELACVGARRYADDCKQSSNYNPSYTTHLHTFLLGREWAKAKQPDQAVPPQAKAPEDEVYRRLVEKEDLAYSDWQSHKRMATSDNPAMQRIADPAGHQQRYEERKKQRQEYEQTQQ